MVTRRALAPCLVVLAGCTDVGYHDKSEVLRDTLASVRWTEPRLSLDGHANVCAPVLKLKGMQGCGMQEASDAYVATLDVLRSDQSLNDSREKALLLLARQDNSDTASELLEAALASDDSAAVWSDIAAAKLLQVDGSDAWKSLESAIVAADHAIRLDPGYARAHFNRALALEALFLNELAAESWARFAEREHDRAWLEEASIRVARLEQSRPHAGPTELFGRLRTFSAEDVRQLVREYPSETHRYFSTDTDLATRISRAPATFCASEGPIWREIGNQFAREYGDYLIVDTVRWTCDGDTAPDVAAVEVLASANAAYAMSESRHALESAIEAEERLAAAHSPLAELSRVLHGAALFLQGDMPAARELLSRSAAETSESYPLLAARSHALLGAISVRAGLYEDALDHYSRGMDLLSGGGDPVMLVRLLSLSAETLATAGKYEQAWQAGFRALSEARRLRLSSSTLSDTCDFLAVVAAESGAKYLQELFADCSVRHLSPEDDPSLAASSYLSRAQARTALGDYTGAEADLDEARSATDLIHDVRRREELLGFLNLFEGLNSLAGSPSSALDNLQRAQRYFGERGNLDYEITAGVSVVDALQALGDKAAAARALEHIGGLLATAQRAARSTDYSLSIHERFRPIVERRMQLDLIAGNAFGALLTLQQARLPKQITGREDLMAVLSALPGKESGEGTLLLAGLEGRVVGWLVDDTGLVRWFETPLPNVKTLVERASATHSIPMAGGRRRALSQLYQAAIAPIAPDLQRYGILRIVPDGFFFGVPFPALWNAQSNRYLIEEIALLISPDLVLASPRSRADVSGYQSIAVFADPVSDPEHPLPAVTRESALIKDLFGPTVRVDVFSDNESTSSAFARALQTYDLVHFGGHGEIDVEEPQINSRLVLNSGDPRRPGAITAGELYSLDPIRMPQLVVLAACDTAAYTDRLPLALALVRPLLEKGAGHVLASIRRVPDHLYLRMMELYYNVLKDNGYRPVEALQRVQVELAASTPVGDVAYWEFLQIYSQL